jgi:hypothetical protein
MDSNRARYPSGFELDLSPFQFESFCGLTFRRLLCIKVGLSGRHRHPVRRDVL